MSPFPVPFSSLFLKDNSHDEHQGNDNNRNNDNNERLRG